MYITADEISMIKAALLYAAEQVKSSDIPVFTDTDTEEQYQANQDKADLAVALAKKLDEGAIGCCSWTFTADRS